MPPEAGTALRSGIYLGQVYHARTAPRAHALRYPVFYLLLDLDEAARLDRVSRLFGWNRRALFSFRDADHGAGDGTPFRVWLDDALATAGLGRARWRYQVLCMPRVLGHVFNPITVVWCSTPDGRLAAMLYEVNNTFGERIAYVVPQDGAPRDGIIRQRCDKRMFVSPFFDMAGHYDFRLTRPGRRLALAIDYREEGVPAPRLRAVLSATRQPFDARGLRAVALRFPAMTLRVVAAIHFEALRLWLKGVPLVRHAALGESSPSIGTSL